jgi:hypothetical protein
MADLARFTQLLFADQTLDDLLTSLDKQAATDGAWILLREAAEHLRQGETGRATEVLLEVTSNPKMATRILLWSWATLRCLGVHPKSYEADDIKGVVIQVPMELALMCWLPMLMQRLAMLITLERRSFGISPTPQSPPSFASY